MSTLHGNNTVSVSTKLNKTKAILSNIRHDVDSITRKAIYHDIIEFLFVLGKKFYSSLKRNL